MLKSLQILKDIFLLEAYNDAMRLNLSPDFIKLLQNEIHQRNLFIQTKTI